MSSPAMLGMKEHRDTIRDYQRAQSTMQFYNFQGDNTIHKNQYTGTQTMHTFECCKLHNYIFEFHPLLQTHLWPLAFMCFSFHSMVSLLSLPRQLSYHHHQSLPVCLPALRQFLA